MSSKNEQLKKEDRRFLIQLLQQEKNQRLSSALFSIGQFFSILTLVVAFIGIFDPARTSFSPIADLILYTVFMGLVAILLAIFGYAALSDFRDTREISDKYKEAKLDYIQEALQEE